MNTLFPAEVFPPGEILRDELEARSWSQTEFAQIIDRPKRLVGDIVNAKRGISPDTALDFAAALGTSAQFWLNLESSYQLFKASLEERSGRDEMIEKKAKLHSKFPVNQLIKNGWIEDSESHEVLEASVLRYYSIDDLDQEPSLQVAAKKTDGELGFLDNQIAWLYRVKNIAETVDSPNYSKAKLRDALAELEGLTEEAEEIRHVPAILNQCGVRFVIVEPAKGSKICGVCFWIRENKTPVVGMTLLHDRIDNFWFVLRHELEHVLRGDGKQAAILDESEEGGQLNSGADREAEEAANAAASDFCVPKVKMDEFFIRLNPIFTEKSVVGFARRVKRHPGLVVGQLQYRLKRWNIFRSRLVKVREIITKTALVDGYGVNIY